MSQTYALANNATAGDRLLNVGNAAHQLRTGEIVQLVYDPSQADPNKISLQLVPGPRTTPSVIATLTAFAASSNSAFSLTYPRPQTFKLLGDKSDNLYVVGPWGFGGAGGIYVQAFVKQAGTLAWSAAAAQQAGSMTPADVPLGVDAVWCDTGGGTGGAGHILVVASANTTQSGAIILDAGRVLKGITGPQTSVITNPTFLGPGTAATAGSNLHLAPDGFGATSGLAISAASLTIMNIGAWGITTGGALTSGGAGIGGPLLASGPCGTLSATTKLRIRRYAPNAFAAVYPSATNPGQLTVEQLTAQGVGFLTADTGTPGNFPAPAASLSWDVITSDPSMQELWIYAWSSATATTMLRLPVTFGSGGQPVIGSPVTDDTAIGTGTPTTIRVPDDIADYQHADWQANGTLGGNPALLGDFSAIPVVPNAPALVTPLNNSAAPLASGGTFTWLFSSPLLADAQASYAFRRQISGGAYQWYTGSALQSTEIFVTSSVASAIFAAGLWTAAAIYGWAVAVKGASGIASPYSAVWSVAVIVPPTAPTLTAAYNGTTNRVTLVATGTAATALLGSIEFSDDGGATWAFVIGATALTIYPGPVTVYDYETSTQAARQYRARAWSPYPLNYSSYATASIAAPVTASFWMIDPQSGTSIAVLIKAGSESTTPVEPMTRHDPLGDIVSVIVADVIHLPDYAVTFTTTNVKDQGALEALLALQRPLFWQSPIQPPKWYRRLSSATSDVPVSGAPWITYHEHACTFAAAARPAP